MIDLHNVWLPQVLGYARIVADDDILPDSWLRGDRTKTSVIDFGELIEQVFEDLDSEKMLVPARAELDATIADLLQRFIDALPAVEKCHAIATSPKVILASREWSEARTAASDLLRHAKP